MFDHPILVGLFSAALSFLLGFLVYRRSIKVDKVAEQSSAAISQVTAINQVITGLNQIVDNLQDDNKLLRESVSVLRESFSRLEIRLKEVTTENYKLETDLRELRVKYNDQ